MGPRRRRDRDRRRHAALVHDALPDHAGAGPGPPRAPAPPAARGLPRPRADRRRQREPAPARPRPRPRHGRDRPLGPQLRRRPAPRRARRRRGGRPARHAAARPARSGDANGAAAAPAGTTPDDALAEAAAALTRPAPTETEIARLRLAWLRYAPFTLSGIVTVGAIAGFALNAANDAHVDPRSVGPLGDLGDALGEHAGRGPASSRSSPVVLLVALFSTAGYRPRVLGLSPHPPSGRDDRTSTRGLLSTRATTIEERRLRGVELSEPLLLRWAGGARCVAIATGLGSAAAPSAAARRCSRPARGASPPRRRRRPAHRRPADRPADAPRPARPHAPLHPRAGGGAAIVASP